MHLHILNAATLNTHISNISFDRVKYLKITNFIIIYEVRYTLYVDISIYNLFSYMVYIYYL